MIFRGQPNVCTARQLANTKRVEISQETHKLCKHTTSALLAPQATSEEKMR